MIKDILTRKNIGIVLGATVGLAGLLYIFQGSVPNPLDPVSFQSVPAELNEIAALSKDNPQEFEVLDKLFGIYKRAEPEANVHTLGLAENKITADKTILESLKLKGYVKFLQRARWRSVWITAKGIREMKAFEDYLNAATFPSSASTNIGIGTTTP